MALGHSLMHRMIEGGYRGEPTTALTREAMDAWFETVRDPRRRDWLAEMIGPGLWMPLNLAPAWVLFEEAEDGWRWQASPARHFGTPAILVPVWEFDPGRWCDRSVVDLIAVDTRAPGRVGSRNGCSSLGERVADQARAAGEPIMWRRDALSWLRDGGDAPEAALVRGDRANFYPFARSALAEELLLGGARIIAADDVHGFELKEQQRRLRARIYSASSIEVPELGEAAE